MKILKVGPVHPMAYETFADVVQDLPIDKVDNRSRLLSAWGYLHPQQLRDRNPGPTVKISRLAFDDGVCLSVGIGKCST